MESAIKEYILAIVTLDKTKVSAGGCPVFLAESREEQERICLLISRVVGGIAHDLENGIFFIVKH